MVQICSLCCPAPLNHQDTCFWLQGDCNFSFSLFISLVLCLFVKRMPLFMCSLFAGNTASVCTFLTTTHSFCRTSFRSCWIFLQNLMSVSFMCFNCFLVVVYLPHFRYTTEINHSSFCLRWPRPHPQPDSGFKDYRAVSLSRLEEQGPEFVSQSFVALYSVLIHHVLWQYTFRKIQIM